MHTVAIFQWNRVDWLFRDIGLCPTRWCPIWNAYQRHREDRMSTHGRGEHVLVGDENTPNRLKTRQIRANREDMELSDPPFKSRYRRHFKLEKDDDSWKLQGRADRFQRAQLCVDPVSSTDHRDRSCDVIVGVVTSLSLDIAYVIFIRRSSAWTTDCQNSQRQTVPAVWLTFRIGKSQI